MTEPDSPLGDYAEAAYQAAQRAGRLLKDNLKRRFGVSKKGRIDLVTEMDVASETCIVDHLLKRFPDHEVLAEEQGKHGQSSPFKWIIDPLDGTTNYAHGFPCFAVSIALEVQGEVQVGVVYDPNQEETFLARRGQGAELNGKPIRVSREARLVDSLVATGFSYRQEKMAENLKHFGRISLEVRAVRRIGSAALDLCYVACGRFDGYWELTLHPWDVAAGKLLVEEAGGRVTRLDGSPASIYGEEFLATNGRIHEAMSRILQENRPFVAD